MKKKLLECAAHGLSLFRCKKRCWKGGSKDRPYNCIYAEQCFKCILEGRVQAGNRMTKGKEKHMMIKVT